MGKKVFLLSTLSMVIAHLAVAAFFISPSSASSIFDVTAEQKAINVLEQHLPMVTGRLVRDFPNNIELTKLAVEFHRYRQNYYKAVKVLERALRLNPGNYDLCKSLAELASGNGDYEKAIKYWEKALSIQPDDWKLYNKIADALISAGKYGEAVERLEAKIKVSPLSARSYHLLGLAYMQLGDYEKSKEYLEKVYKTDPEYFKIHYLLGKVYRRLKQPEKAKKHMQLYRKNPNEESKGKKGPIRRGDGDLVYDQTKVEIDAFSVILARLCILGSELYRLSGNDDDAKALFEKAEDIFEQGLGVAPGQPDMCRELAFMYISTKNKPAKALEFAKKAVERRKSARNYFILGLAYNENANMEQTLSALKKAVELEPDNKRYKKTYNEIKRKNMK